MKSIILPVPSATTKGVVLCRTAYGNLLVGPTAEEQESRCDAGTDRETLAMLRDKGRSEEHTSELQSLMRISYAVFCLKKKTKTSQNKSKSQHNHTLQKKNINKTHKVKKR